MFWIIIHWNRIQAVSWSETLSKSSSTVFYSLSNNSPCSRTMSWKSPVLSNLTPRKVGIFDKSWLIDLYIWFFRLIDMYRSKRGRNRGCYQGTFQAVWSSSLCQVYRTLQKQKGENKLSFWNVVVLSTSLFHPPF